MTAVEGKRGYVPNPHYTQEDWDDVDSPELTDEQLAQAKPLAETMPEFLAAVRRTRGPQRAQTKELVSLRLDRHVLAKFRATGPGWQTRINDALQEAAGALPDPIGTNDGA